MQESAGLMVFRRSERGPEVFLVHPGGPFFARKDDGAWSIPKGLLDPGEDALAAARREFCEETSLAAPSGEHVPLGETRLASGKRVHAWAIEGELDPTRVASNTFELEWPQRSGKRQEFPEIDRADWFDLDAARVKLNPAQGVFVERLAAHLAGSRR